MDGLDVVLVALDRRAVIFQRPAARLDLAGQVLDLRVRANGTSAVCFTAESSAMIALFMLMELLAMSSLAPMISSGRDCCCGGRDPCPASAREARRVALGTGLLTKFRIPPNCMLMSR